MNRVQEIWRALHFSINSPRNIFSTAALSFLTYLILIWASNPTLADRTLSNGLHLIDDTFLILTAGSIEISGLIGFGLIIMYSVLSGATITNLIGQIQIRGFRNLFKIGGIAPGIIASGCAGCGAGLAALLGVSGALAVLPFQGNLIRLVGIGLLFFFLSSSGDPRKCEI